MMPNVPKCPNCNGQNCRYYPSSRSFFCTKCHTDFSVTKQMDPNLKEPEMTVRVTNEIPVTEEQAKMLNEGDTQFNTGAVRSADKAGVMYHLITPIGLRRIAETYKEGFDKYGANNWEKGMPIGDILNHAIAHIFAYLSGEKTEEDDLAHAAWNLLAAMHMEETHADNPALDHQLRFKPGTPK